MGAGRGQRGGTSRSRRALRQIGNIGGYTRRLPVSGGGSARGLVPLTSPPRLSASRTALPNASARPGAAPSARAAPSHLAAGHPDLRKSAQASGGKRLMGRSPTKQIGAPVPGACCLQASPRAPQHAAPYALRSDGDPQVGQESLLADTAPPPTLCPRWCPAVCAPPPNADPTGHGDRSHWRGAGSLSLFCPGEPVRVPVCPGPSASWQPRRRHSGFGGRSPGA